MSSNLLTSSILFLSVLSVISTVCYNAQAQSTHDKVYRVTIPGTSKSCLEEAEDLSRRFQLATGITQVKAECSATQSKTIQGQDYTFYSVTIFYPANTQLSIDKTRYGHYEGGLPGGINSVGDYYGAYDSYSSCLQAISTRIFEFENYTGLKAISSYCSKGRVDDTFVLNIDSFGKQKMNLFTFDAGNWSKGEEIKKYLFQNDAITVHTKGTRFYYYAKKSLNLGQHRLLSYQDENICYEQLETAKNIIKAYGSDSDMVRCIKRVQVKNDNFHLIALFSGSNFFKTRYMNEGYVSFEQCLSDIPRVKVEYADTYRRAPLGVLCSKETSSVQNEQYIMEVFTHL